MDIKTSTSWFHFQSNSINRTANGNLILSYFDNGTKEQRVMIANGDDFSTPTDVLVQSIPSYYGGYGMIHILPSGDLVEIHRDTTGSRYHRVYKSTDNGLTWTSLGYITTVGTIGLWSDIDSNGVLYYAADVGQSYIGSYKSTDGGSTWTNINVAIRRWYPVVKYDWVANKVIFIGSEDESVSDKRPHIKEYDIATGTWSTEVRIPDTGYIAYRRIIIRNVIIMPNGDRYLYTNIRQSSDSTDKGIYEHYWPAGGAIQNGVYLCDGTTVSGGTDHNGDRHIVVTDANTGYLWYQKNGGTLEVLRQTTDGSTYRNAAIHLTPPWKTTNGSDGHIIAERRSSSGAGTLEYIGDKVFSYAPNYRLIIPGWFGL